MITADRLQFIFRAGNIVLKRDISAAQSHRFFYYGIPNSRCKKYSPRRRTKTVAESNTFLRNLKNVYKQ